MPELPEVEVARRNVQRWLKGRRIVAAEASPGRTFRGADPERFAALRGKLVRAERKGKYLLLTFDAGQGLLGHLGMTGKLTRRKQGQDERYSRARLILDNGDVIHYRDPRLLGRLKPTDAEALWELPEVKALGRDPFTDGLSAEQLQDAVGSSRQELKVALMDQARVAGLGNIHAAEALHRARLHPARRPQSLSADEWKRLARAIHETLAFGLERTQAEEVRYVEEGADVENPFRVYGKAGEPCPRCRTAIQSFPQGGRTTYFCPRCQPKGRGRGARPSGRASPKRS